MNSCPMFSFTEKDRHRMPQTTRTYLPLKPEGISKEEELKKLPPGAGSVFDDNDPRENEVHPELLRLPSSTLKGTFLKSYKLLNKICSRVGWDELLKYRSRVFVMEEEYRIHRAIQEEDETESNVAIPSAGYSDDDDDQDEFPNAPPQNLPGSDDEYANKELSNEENARENGDEHSDVGNSNSPINDNEIVAGEESDDILAEKLDLELRVKTTPNNGVAGNSTESTDQYETSSPLFHDKVVSPTKREEFSFVDREDEAVSGEQNLTPEMDASVSPQVQDFRASGEHSLTPEMDAPVSPIDQNFRAAASVDSDEFTSIPASSETAREMISSNLDPEKVEYYAADDNYSSPDDMSPGEASAKSDDTIGKSESRFDHSSRLGSADGTSESLDGRKKLSVDMIMRKIESEKQYDDTTSQSAGKSTRAPNPRPNRQSISFHFRRKRLCEKWLDNLFMVLYNDLRLYTALKQV